jgi:hypothetical protein
MWYFRVFVRHFTETLLVLRLIRISRPNIDALEDVHTRFILNLPESELQTADPFSWNKPGGSELDL